MKARISLLAVSFLSAFLATASAVPPPNDKFSKPIPLTGTIGSVTANNVDATFEPGEFAFHQNGSVWYTFTAPSDGVLQFRHDYSNDQGGNVSVEAFSGAAIKKLAFLNPTTAVDNNSGEMLSTLLVNKGVTYHISVASDFLPGSVLLKYHFTAGGALVFTGGRRSLQVIDFAGDRAYYPQRDWTFTEASGGTNVIVNRVGGSEGALDVDWSITDFGTDASDFTGVTSGQLHFASGETSKVIPIGFAADNLAEGSEGFGISLNITSGDAVTTGDVQATLLDSDDVPENDDFDDAITITGTSGTIVTKMGTPTFEPDEPELHMNSVWYKWVAPGNGEFAVDSGPYSVALYTGQALSDALPVRPLGQTGRIELAPNLHFPVTQGTTYYLMLQDDFGAGGGTSVTYEFNVREIFRLSELNYQVREGNAIDVSVLNIGSKAAPSQVTYKTVTPDDTDDDSNDAQPAKAEDFLTIVATQLQFAAGDTTKSFSTSAKTDAKKEPFEFYDVAIETPVPVDSNDPIVDPAFRKARVFIADALAKDSVFDYYFHGGLFQGMLQTNTGAGIDGLVQVKFAAKRMFTGYAVIDGYKASFQGTYPSLVETNGVKQFHVTLPLTLKNGATASLTLDGKVVAGISTLSGTVTTNSSTATFVGLQQAFFSSSFTCPIAGTYTVKLSPDTTNQPNSVRAPGYASITVKTNGGYKLTGSLPDGTKLTGGGFVAQQSIVDDAGVLSFDAPFTLPINVQLYGNTGSFTGLFTPISFATEAAPVESDAQGTFRWQHPALTQGFVTTAFRATLPSNASRFSIAKNALFLPLTLPASLKIHISGAGLMRDSGPITVGAGNKLTTTSGDMTKPSLTISLLDGTFSGSITVNNTKLKIFGVLMRNTASGVGYFLNGSQAGTMTLAP